MKIVIQKTCGAVLLILTAAVCPQVANAQDRWSGEYFYGEDGGETAGGTKIYIGHTIVVTEHEGKIEAHIYSQGFQTSRDIFAEGKADGDSLKLYFLAKGPDQVFGNFKTGDHLLTLYRDGGSLKTCWGKFVPALDSNLENGRIRFKRVSGDKSGWIEGRRIL